MQSKLWSSVLIDIRYILSPPPFVFIYICVITSYGILNVIKIVSWHFLSQSKVFYFNFLILWKNVQINLQYTNTINYYSNHWCSSFFKARNPHWGGGGHGILQGHVRAISANQIAGDNTEGRGWKVCIYHHRWIWGEKWVTVTSYDVITRGTLQGYTSAI